MNNQPSEPGRALHKNFTAATLRRAKRAKNRLGAGLVRRASFGVAIAAIALVFSGMGAYAVTNNWFQGTVDIRQEGQIITLDLTGCDLPPGVHGSDKRNVKFKVMSENHVSPQELQRAMTVECEFNAVRNFFLAQPVSANFWASTPATILAINGEDMTFRYLWGGALITHTLNIKNARVFENRQTASLAGLKAGDHILLAVTSETQGSLEGRDVFAEPLADSKISIYKTQYDTAQAPGASKKGIYEQWNIMPLDWYEQVKDRL